MDAALVRPCRARAWPIGVTVSLDWLVDDELVDEFEELDDDEAPELLDAFAALDAAEELAVGWVGEKTVLPVPKPIAAAAVPVPAIVMMSLVFLLVKTSSPLALSAAVTLALVGRSTLTALIRSATVSVPVDV